MGLRLSRWLVAAGRATGLRHEREGRPCDDRVRFTRSSQVTVLALADGAGSASHAGLGADIAVRTALSASRRRRELLLHGDVDAAAAAILRDVRTAVARAAREADVIEAALASTLAVVVVGDDRYFTGQVGDGVVVAETAGGSWRTLLPGQRGEHANETVFVTSARAEMAAQQGALADERTFAVMSDGAADVLWDRDSGSTAVALHRMAAWLDDVPPRRASAAIARAARDVFRRRTTDDCSLGVLRRVELDLEFIRSDRGLARGFLGCRGHADVEPRLALLVDPPPASPA